MIYSLRGKLIETAENTVVVECVGVGYLCSTTRTTLNSLPQKGSEVMLYTYMNVREGAVDLFGFSTLSEKNCFCRLTSVSGVGPKVALAILSELKPDQLSRRRQKTGGAHPAGAARQGKERGIKRTAPTGQPGGRPALRWQRQCGRSGFSAGGAGLQPERSGASHRRSAA